MTATMRESIKMLEERINFHLKVSKKTDSPVARDYNIRLAENYSQIYINLTKDIPFG